jgi:outer membrane biosynthesis protein TonB
MTAVSARVRVQQLNRGFGPLFIFSLLVHAGALGAVVFGQHLKGRPQVQMNSIPVQLVKLGKLRDPNLLPQITRPPPPPPDEGIALDTKDETRPNQPTKERPKAKDPQLSDAAKRLLESRPDDLDRAVGRIEEDEGSPEGSIYGTTTDPTNAASGYLAQVGAIIQHNYKLPATIAESERRFLSAEVVLYIQRDGTVSKYDIVKIHPNDAFRRALELVLQSLKLPPPPAALASEYANSGLGVIFKPLK